MLDQLIGDLEGFDAALRRGTSVNINDQSSKDRAIALAMRYFSEAQPFIASQLVGADLGAHDATWQQLVRLAHGNSARTRYRSTVTQLRKGLIDYRIAVLTAAKATPVTEAHQVTYSTEETLILKTLEGLVPSAAASYRQGLTDLNGPERISYRGTAAEFRESVRETLDHLAPDAEVEAVPGFAFEKDQKKPTRKQKMRHVLKSRGHNKTQRESAEKSLSVVDELAGDVMTAVYSRASLATHVETSKAEVRKIKRYVDTLFIDLLEIG